MVSYTPLKDALDAGEECVGLGFGKSVLPTQGMIDDEAAEVALLVASWVNDKFSELTTAYQTADKTVFADYTEEQQKTFYKQEHEARAWLSDSNQQTPFIDGMVTIGWRTKQELVDRIIVKADILSTAYGALMEKYQHLIDRLVDIDINGDHATEQTKIELIVW